MVFITGFKPPWCASVLQQDLLEIFCTSHSYKIPRTSMKPLSKSALNIHGRCYVSRILYLKIYKIVHMCFCDFQSIDGLDFRVHACMFATATYRGLWISEPWRDSVGNCDSRISVCWSNHVCTSFNLGKHSRPPPPFFICCWLLVSILNQFWLTF